MYQAAIESLLGLRRRGATFSVNPTIPAMWPEYSLDWTIDGTEYHIQVSNPAHQCRGVESARLDGKTVSAERIPLILDGRRHEVTIVLGRGGGRDA